MARPASTTLHDQSATLRQLKLLVMVLVLSNIGLGVVSFYLLRRVDRRYTELIDQSVPVLNHLQTLTVKSVVALRGTNPALFKGKDNVKALEEARHGFSEERALRERVLKVEWIADLDDEKSKLRVAGGAFSQIGNAMVAQLATGDLELATRLREESLRPAFERYVAATTTSADILEAASRRANTRVSANTGSIATVLFGIASWPVVLLVALLLLTAIFVLVLMVLFRGREMSDMP